jgi:hypothetical protein
MPDASARRSLASTAPRAAATDTLSSPDGPGVTQNAGSRRAARVRCTRRCGSVHQSISSSDRRASPAPGHARAWPVAEASQITAGVPRGTRGHTPVRQVDADAKPPRASPGHARRS